jgi:hypothetical protein
MKKTIFTGVIAASLLPLMLSAADARADFIHKQYNCPGNGKMVVPTGSRFDIDDIIISTTKDQNITLKFVPSNRIFARLFLKTRVPFVANFSGEVESNDEQGLNLDCAGVAGTTVTITVTGNGNL